MKKTIYLFAAAAVLALVSCQNEIDPDNGGLKDPVFKANIETTRTTINASTCKISWEEGDEVSITDAASTTVIYVASEIDGGSATLTKKAGESGTLGDGPYTAVYGSAPSASQSYSATVPSLPMEAQSNDRTFTFNVTCGLLELTLMESNVNIKSIAVSNGTTTYRLECSPAVSITSGGIFYIALPAGGYTSFTFTNAAGEKCVKNLKAGKSFTIPLNTIQPLDFPASSLSFSIPEDALAGVFSVGPDKTVLFSKGNLQYQASSGKWRFAEHQYDVIGDNAGNNVAENRDTQADWIDLFGWGTTGRTDINSYLKQPYETMPTSVQYKTMSSAASGEALTKLNGGDWGINLGDGWRTLTGDELSFLFGTEAPRASNLKRLSTVTFAPGITAYGIVLMPDGWSGSLTGTINQSTWESLESAGAVFFPASGCRQEASVSNTAWGYYWAATSTGSTTAKTLFFNSSGTLRAPNDLERRFGCSVRLVND